MNHETTHAAADVERGNEALPAAAHHWDELDQTHNEMPSAPRVAVEHTVTTPVQIAPVAAPTPADTQPASTEPKIP